MRNRNQILNFILILIFLLPSFQIAVSSESSGTFTEAIDKDVEIIRERIIANLMRPGVDEDEVESVLKSLRPEGSWPGIDYEDVSRTGWDQSTHMSNMVAMARAFKQDGNRFSGDQQLKRAIHSALEFWLEHDFICDNWWWNQIGTPRTMLHLILIMDDDLTESQKRGATAITDRANMQASGARQSGDRIFMAGLRGMHGAFLRDPEILEHVTGIMASDIQIVNDGPGIRADLSYHHRQDNVVSTLTYGLHPPRIYSTWALKLEGTRFEFPESSTELLVDYYLDGVCRSMVYAKYSDPGVQNREISRMGVLNPLSPAVPEALYQTSHHRRDELRTIAEIRRGETEPDLRYTTVFWQSDYFIHQRPDWYASVRMYSDRKNNIDAPHNSEGLRNHHFADGANFLTRTAEEYVQIFPVWNWQRVPGTTVVQKPQLPHWREIVRRGTTSFVGGVTDGEYGGAVFDFDSPHDPLQARKSWFFFDDEFVALGSGVTSSADYPVNTSIGQLYLKGDVIAGQGDLVRTILRGEHNLEEVSWVHHDNVAYVFPSASDVSVRNRASTGNWRQINHTHWATSDEIREDLFTLWFDHGIEPVNDSYEYIVVPGIELSQVSGYSGNIPLRVLVNSPLLQAVKHDGLGIVQAVFYEPGELELGDGNSVTVDKPCMIMVKLRRNRIESIAVSDPGQAHNELQITVNSRVRGGGERWSSDWNRRERASVITVDMPEGKNAGQSVIISP